MPTTASLFYPTGRVEQEAERRNALEDGRRRHNLRLACEEEAHGFDEADAKPESDQKLVFVRPVIKVTDDDAFDRHPEHHHEERTGDHRNDERLRVVIGHQAGITSEHEHRAMRKVQHAERAIDDGQPRADQRQQRTECEPVEKL
jgi:hypothetical protein